MEYPLCLFVDSQEGLAVGGSHFLVNLWDCEEHEAARWEFVKRMAGTRLATSERRERARARWGGREREGEGEEGVHLSVG